MNVLSLFDGMSCGQIALNRAGIAYDKYYASEIDKHAIAVTQHNYPNTKQLGDVTKITTENAPKIDLLIGGSPCQGFSFAGNELNFDDPRSKLFFEYVRLLKELKPEYFLLENVVMKQEYQDIISSYLGVKPVKINSALVSAQNRERLYWTNIPFSIPVDRGIMLKDVIGEYEGVWVFPRGYNKGGVQSYKGKSPCLTTSSWQYNFKPVRGGVVGMFEPEEAEQLQTVPVGYTSCVSKGARFKMLGNGWTVDVIAHILKGIYAS
jgi:DNA (cytosine-5)-methyltransferase 3A